MEVFDGAYFVRLRSVERRGKYLAADVDGFGVCLSGQRDTHNAVWAVRHAEGPYGRSVLLRGAYGRCLFATVVRAPTSPPEAVLAAQADLDQVVPPPGMLWHAARRRDSFVVRCGLGRYLRANGRYRRWRRYVTVAEDNDSTMMQWAIEIVPLRLTQPSIPDPTYQQPGRQLKHMYRSRPTEGEVTRLIQAIRCDPSGRISERGWWAMDLNTNSLILLRCALASSFRLDDHDMANTIICIRAGRYGPLSPLHIDLPLGNNRIDIVLVTHGHGTSAGRSLLYPDLNAPE